MAGPALDLHVRAALFDMDGTLVDSTAVVVATWATFAARHGIDLADLLAYAHGRLTIDTATHFLPPGADAAAEAGRVDAAELVDFQGIVPIPGAPEVLAALAGARVAVVTSASRELATRRLAAAGVPRPEVLVSAEDVSTGKPSPEGYLRAAQLLDVPITQCVIFEDAEAGIRAAVASGARVVVVGPLDSPVTAGLARIASFEDLRVDVDPDEGSGGSGLIHLSTP